GQRSLGHQTQLAVMGGALGDSALNLRHDGDRERRQHIDIALAPVTRSFVKSTEGTEHIAIRGAKRDAGVSAYVRAAVREARLVPGIRQDYRASASDNVLAVAALQGIPAGGFRGGRA